MSARRLVILLASLGLLLAACGDEEATPPPASGNNAATNNSSGSNNANSSQQNNTNNTNNATNNTPGNNAPSGCTSDAMCNASRQERCLSDGTCAGRWDRRCAGAADCRSEETCEALDGGLSVCVAQDGAVEVCPGGPSCPAGAASPLRAGAAKVTITPEGFEVPLPEYLDGVLFAGDPDVIDGEVTFRDCGLDLLCPGDPGYAGPDFGEGDGHMQGAWLAGFDHSRPAARWCEPAGPCPEDQPWLGRLAHDDVWARTVVFEQGETRVALVVVDTVGYFQDEEQRVRGMLREDAGIDLLIVASTHNHEGPDTMGQWGPGVFGDDLPISTGAERWWLDYVNTRIVQSIHEALDDLQPVVVQAARGDTGVEGVGLQDSRDPWIIDDDLAVMRLTHAESGAPVATLVNWGNHVEALSDENAWITSDYPGPARDYIEAGLPEVVDSEGQVLKAAVPGTGGVAIFVVGAVGGLVTPLRGATAVNRAGDTFRSGSWGMADAMGQQLAERTLGLLASAPAQEAPGLSFASQQLLMPVENVQFHTAITGLQLFDRELYNATTQRPFGPGNLPHAQTRMSVVRVGEVTLLTVPGEAFPETVAGGFEAADPSGLTPVRGNPSRLECGEELMPLACATSAECPDNWSCHVGQGFCRPQGASCADTCGAAGLTCEAGTCLRRCEDESACGAGFACQGGACTFDPGLALASEAAWPCMVRPDNPNKPDVAAAIAQGHVPLKAQVPGSVPFLVGMGHDELGYIVPEYDFKVAEDGAYLVEADGDHYEETNSVGPEHLPTLRRTLTGLLSALPR